MSRKSRYELGFLGGTGLMPDSAAGFPGARVFVGFSASLSSRSGGRGVYPVKAEREEMIMATTSEVPASAGAATHATIRSSLGDLTVVTRGGTVTGLYFPHHWHMPDRGGFGQYRDAGFEEVRRQLDEYLAGERREFDVPVERPAARSRNGSGS